MQAHLASGDDFGSGLRAALTDLEAQTGIVRAGFEKIVLCHANGDEQIFLCYRVWARTMGPLVRCVRDGCARMGIKLSLSCSVLYDAVRHNSDSVRNWFARASCGAEVIAYTHCLCVRNMFLKSSC